MEKGIQQELSQSRILFEQVVVDNEPSEQEVIQRAEELQIDDLSLARQSLTKQLQPHWRPYITRNGSIYYINLKQQRAYTDHPVDMDTKLLYAKRYKTTIPKFKSYQIQDVITTLRLIEEETIKWKREEFSFTRQQFMPTQLNIVYQESQESQSQRESQVGIVVGEDGIEEQDEEEYIENLQHTARLRSKDSARTKTIQHNNELPLKTFDKRHKKFPTLQDQSSDEQSKMSKHLQQYYNQDQPLPPQYEKLLIQYEEQLIKQNHQKLNQYKHQKQQNFNKKQQILNDSIKRKQDAYKFNILTEFQRQTEEKNRVKFEKDCIKIKKQFTQKLYLYEQKLQKDYEIMQKLLENLQQKQRFVQSLEQTLQSRLSKQKLLKSQSMNKNLYENIYLLKINELSSKEQYQFDETIHKIIHSKINQKLRQKGVYSDDLNKVIYPESLAAIYESMVKKELKNIDNLLIQNEVSKQNRKRRKNFFPTPKQPHKQSQTQSNKQNDINTINTYNQKFSIVSQIEKDILKSCQNRIAFRQRRNKIFGTLKPSIQSQDLNEAKEEMTQLNQTKLHQKKIKKQLWQKQNYLSIDNLVQPDRKSMYLRMMRRIL